MDGWNAGRRLAADARLKFLFCFNLSDLTLFHTFKCHISNKCIIWNWFYSYLCLFLRYLGYRFEWPRFLCRFQINKFFWVILWELYLTPFFLTRIWTNFICFVFITRKIKNYLAIKWIIVWKYCDTTSFSRMHQSLIIIFLNSIIPTSAIGI